MRDSMPESRKEELTRPMRPSSKAVLAAALRSLRLFEVRDEYVVATELVLHNAVLVFGDCFEVVPNVYRSRRMMGNCQYAREPRPTRSWPVPHPDRPLSNVATMRMSCDASVDSCLLTIFQPFPPASQPRHHCTDWHTAHLLNPPISQLFQP